MEFNLFKASKFPSISDKCHRLNVIDNLVRQEVTKHVSSDPLNRFMLNDSKSKDENPKVSMCAYFLESFHKFHLLLQRWKNLHCDKPLSNGEHALRQSGNSLFVFEV